jgi:hypothetical protein
MPRSLTTFPHEGKTVFHAGRGQARVGVFDRGAVTLFDPASGSELLRRPAHRGTFAGVRKLRRWSLTDALYFFGYAFASYAAVPFVLPALRFRHAVSSRWRGDPLEGVGVEFPPDADVHSRRQRFYFASDGLLRRNDYVAEIIGPCALGAHGWDDFQTLAGLPFPTRRTVLVRLAAVALPFPAVLLATFEDLAVCLGSEAPAAR